MNQLRLALKVKTFMNRTYKIQIKDHQKQLRKKNFPALTMQFSLSNILKKKLKRINKMKREKTLFF